MAKILFLIFTKSNNLKTQAMYIIIERFGDVTDFAIAVNEDGENLVFDTKEEAQDYAQELQNPLVIYIG